MTFLERHLAPFVEERQRAGWRGLVWLTLLVLAPAAYVAAIALGARLPTAGIRYVKPAAMMERAEAVARERGVDVNGWRRVMVGSFYKDLGPYFDDIRFQRLPPAQLRFAPYAFAKVTFFAPAQARWFEVRLRPDASLIGFRMSDNLAPDPRNTREEEARQLATEELARTLAPPAGLGLNEAEMLPGDSAGTRRFQWKADFAGLPEFRGLFIVDVRGDRVTAVREDFSVDAAALAAKSPAWWKNFSLARGLVAVLLAFYGIYRFARRSMEKEVAYSRCAVLFAGTIALILTLFLLNTGLPLGETTPEQLSASYLVQVMIMSLVGIGINGILLALTYGGSEGELRETYPGKLTSLDALLTGRWMSANAGRAVVMGIAAAGWGLLLYMAGEHLFPSAIPRMSDKQVMLTYVAHGWLALLVREPYMAMFGCTFALLLPLMLANRRVAHRRARVWAIVALSLLGATVGVEIETPYAWAFLRVAVVSGLVLVAFWLGDLLTAVTAANLFMIGYTVSLLAPLGGDWPGVVRYVVMATVFTGVVALAAVYRGVELTDEAVRPKYAERMLERLGLQAEVSAAREAQLRLLPAELPQVPGLRLAASCTPAQEVGGDFYDFFPLRGGGLGILVAEGGSTGLASALSIGLAKGFLLYAAEKHWPPGEALRRLRPVLLRAVKGNIDKLGLAYLTVDGQGQMRVARFGVYPKLMELTPGQPPRELELLGVAEADFVGERAARLADGAVLLIATDGLLDQIRQRSGADLQAWLTGRKHAGAGQLHGALLSEIGGAAEDDITMVVVERLAPAMELREGVA